MQFLHFKNKKLHFKNKYIKDKITDNKFEKWIDNIKLQKVEQK